MLSPDDGYRQKHAGTLKLSWLLTWPSLRERSFYAEMCLGLHSSICPGQKPFGPRVCKGPERQKASICAGGTLSLIISFHSLSWTWPWSVGMSFTAGNNNTRVFQEDSVSATHFPVYVYFSCKLSESLAVVHNE